jgi:tetraacyldisaccharide 4'-kinase
MPLSWTWSGAARLAGALGARRSVQVEGTTVVSVGNLAVGGTGKTPIVGWIARLMEKGGERAAIVVGGAGGDEAALLSGRLPHTPVLQDRDRVAAAERAREAGKNVVILDDGFQHRKLARSLDVVLLSVEDRFPGPVLPAGPYREPARALRRADVVIVTRRRATAEQSRALAEKAERYAGGKVLAGAELASTVWHRLGGGPSPPPEGETMAVCGIARPDLFQSSVAAQTLGVVELVAFPDHHEYTPADVAALVERSRGRPLVITEKDAVKLRTHADTLGDVYVLCEEVTWDWGEEAVSARLESALGHHAGA